MSEENKKPINQQELQNEHEVSEQELQAIMAKYDRESATRIFTDYRNYIIWGICLVFSIMQLIAGFTGTIPATQLRPLHLAFVLLLTYLLYPIKKTSARKNRLPWYDLGLAVLSFGVCIYLAINHQQIAMDVGKAANLVGYQLYYTRIVVAVLLVVLLAEACRRVVGYPILIIASLFVLYALFGDKMPGFLAHKPLKWERILSQLVFTTEGIMGTPLGASATFIFLFVLFGAFLETTKVGQFFIDLANSVAGHKRGGPAKVAVLSSALMGTVSGSSVANTVGTGSFTIPMMKKLGYRGEFAGAVEAAASTGGQIMPPVMGAAAFLMAESVGVGYNEVVKAAIIPALLYFVGIWIIIDLEARKYGLKGLNREDMPILKKIIIQQGYLIFPLLTIIVFLVMRFTPIFAALVGIAAAAFCGMIRRIIEVHVERTATKVGTDAIAEGLKRTGIDILTSLRNGAKGVLSVAIACGMAGIIVGMITLTGLGLKMGNGLVDLAGGSVILTLMLTMVSSIILGMGVPTTANYLITSTVMAPAVIAVMGGEAMYPVLAAHMFVFYFGIVADITPPVALAAMAGSAIAKSNPMATGVNATKLAIAAFLVPYIFAFNPKMLMIDAQWYEVVQIAITSIIGMVGVGAALEGYFTRRAHLLQRLMFLAGGLLLIDTAPITDLIGIGLIALAAVWQMAENKRWGGKLEPSSEYFKSMSSGKRVKTFFSESFVLLIDLITGKEPKQTI